MSSSKFYDPGACKERSRLDLLVRRGSDIVRKGSINLVRRVLDQLL